MKSNALTFMAFYLGLLALAFCLDFWSAGAFK